MIRDYNIYTYTKKEWLRYFLQGAVIGGGIGYLFYSSPGGMLIASLYGFIYVHNMRKQLVQDRKWQLNLEFRDGLSSISAALNAGYSAENAFGQASMDLRLLYDQEALVVQEFEGIVRQIEMNKPLEEILKDFARRSGVEDINNFAEVFDTGKRTGGDLIRIIRSTENIIGGKIEVNREIVTLITAKKFESKIMNLIPFGIIFYLRAFSPGFLDPLYHNLPGIIFMTIILVLYYLVRTISAKIIRIEV